MILVFGSLNVDLVARVPAIPRPGETVLAPGYATTFGGKGANQAVAAALASPPGRVAMAGAVGDDAFGRDCRANLAARGVDAAGVRTVAEPTGCAFITVDDAGENAITVAAGANRAPRAAAVPDGALEAGGVLVMQMEVPATENAALARRARAAGMRVLLNLAPAPAGSDPAALAALLAAVDLLVVNEHELRTACAALCPDVDVGVGVGADRPHGDAAAALAAAAGLVCIVTLGPAGAVAVDAQGAVTAAPALPVEAVDTTGAGDAFVGVLAAGLAAGLALGAAMTRACAGASLACRALGAQTAMADGAAIDAAMASDGGMGRGTA